MKWKGVTQSEKNGESQPRENEGGAKPMGERQTNIGGVTISNSNFSCEPSGGSNHREVAPTRLEVKSTDLGSSGCPSQLFPGIST